MTSAVDLADLCLAAALRSGAVSLRLEPERDRYALTAVDATGACVSHRVERDLGAAAVVRLALLAGADPWAEEPTMGRLRLVAEGRRQEYAAVLGRAPEGPTLELRRMAEVPQLEQTRALPDETPSRAGAYRIEEELGRGGMGVVFAAVHEPTSRRFAVKVLHAELAQDRSVAAQFVSEGRAASVANGTDTVNVVDFGVLPDGRAYLVMELVQGKTLEAVLADGPVEPRRALLVARRIAAALEATHVRGVIHRDLKPSNIFLDPLDRVKIADFGAAKVLQAESTTTGRGIIMGTPLYMSPEQGQGLPTDESTDIYALGCILYRMIAGVVPYPGNRLVEVLMKKLSTPPPPLTSPYGHVPPSVAALVSRTLARRPEDRPPSAGAVAAEIEAILLRWVEGGRL